MFWYYFAYSLFILGASLGVIGNGSEISLWFVSMGWVLEMTLVLLVGLRSPNLPGIFSHWANKILQIAAQLTFPVMFYYRLRADMSVYKVLLALCLLFWSLSLVTTPTNTQNDQEKK